MSITFKNYNPKPFFTDDYKKVRDFLMRINCKKLYTPRFLWGAWEWAVTHSGRDQDNLGKIGIWEENNKIVALATYECPLGEGFLFVDEDYNHLKPDLVAYAKESLHNNGDLQLILPSGDCDFARIAISQGFRPTQRTDRICVLDIDALQSFSLPDGFSFVSMADDWDWQQYNRVMWCGFDHEGEPSKDNETISERKKMLSSPMINPEIVVVVKTPDGKYASHCGMWYQPNDFYCLVEPVVTIPEYRGKGLGKAVVLEAIKRCGELGAKQAVVVSWEQFYYNIGFYPLQHMIYWKLKNISTK